MSNKEKVIARVRELCPETMQLTFGCEVIYDGEKVKLLDLARKHNINYHSLYNRIHSYNFSVEEAVSRKIRFKRKSKTPLSLTIKS